MAMTARKLVGRSDRVELGFLESLRKRCAHHRLLLESLGELYTKVGRYEDGLQVDLELTRLYPREALVWYNLGCSFALLSHKEEALAALAKAIDLGYVDARWMCKDEDLESLREDPRFKILIRRTSSGKVAR